MKSIRTIYKIGQGPSSSHTVAPFAISKMFRKKYPDADSYKVVLFGSMASTGGGHGTKSAISKILNNVDIICDYDTKDLPHPNTLDFYAYKDGKELGKIRALSIGGGVYEIVGETIPFDNNLYPHSNFTEIINYCKDNCISLHEYVYRFEDNKIKEYLLKIWKAMEDCIERGLNTEGVLPGGLGINRKAKLLYNALSDNEDPEVTLERMISAYSYAAMEENADQGIVVTAPTCGSSGVIPSLLYYFKHQRGYKNDEIIDALATAGIVGEVIVNNASISGAECGCQAEIGSACSMAAAALGTLFKMDIDQIEYAAEVAMEHNLGLTCDPIKGLVQIPCIERNAVAAIRALNSTNLARFLYTTRKISFDSVVQTMYKTGKDMNEKYRETAHGGLATIYKDKI